jgi:hypothetical protein
MYRLAGLDSAASLFISGPSHITWASTKQAPNL